MPTISQRAAFEAFVRSGKSPVPPSEVDRPLADGSYRTSAANAGWVFWQAAQAALDQSQPAAAKNGWERLTPEAFERIRKAGYGEGGTHWLCVPNKHGKTPDVVQGDYVGMAFYPGTQEMREAFKTDMGQFISVCDVSHTMFFHPPAPPESD